MGQGDKLQGTGVWSGFKVSREQEPAQDELTEEEVEKETIAK